MYKKLQKFLQRKKIQIIQKKRVANFKKRIIKAQKQMKKVRRNNSFRFGDSIKC